MGTDYLSDEMKQELAAQFTYHPPQGDQTARYERIRDAAHKLALVVGADCPPSADRSAAFRKIREAVMTANAAIAIGEAEFETTTA